MVVPSAEGRICPWEETMKVLERFTLTGKKALVTGGNQGAG
jgi:hypothetical protein